MTADKIENVANDPDLQFYREELTKAETLKDALFAKRNESAIAMLRYDAARKAWARLFVAYDEKLTEAMR